MNEQIVDLSVLGRAAASVLTIGAFIGALAVWVIPEMSFTGSAVAAKSFISLALLVLGAIFARVAFHGSRVKVQIDTNAGELRQVTTKVTGREISLGHFGLDTIEAVDVVTSRADRSFGQVQITLNSGLVIAVGDGAVTTLYPLRDRLASDCGIVRGGEARPTVWTGPLAA